MAVAVIATLDTKGEEAAYLREIIIQRGFGVTLIDPGVLGEVSLTADVSREAVARAGGSSLSRLRANRDRATAVTVMARGLERLIEDLHHRGEISGVIAVGGSGGTELGTAAMRRLPLGVPKVMVSTLASGDVRRFVGMKDICMVHSVTDFSGVNAIMAPILRNAAGTVCGMLEAAHADGAQSGNAHAGAHSSAPLVAASMFGVTTPCVHQARDVLRARGFELVPFHATGIGGRTMESLIDEGHFAAVLDITTTEWADEVVGGRLGAGPERLGAAASAGLPAVVVPGAMDIVNFAGEDEVPARFKGRTLHRHNPGVTLMRTSAQECREIARRVAEKLNTAAGPTTVLIPLKGFSALDIEGGPFWDPRADTAFLDGLKQHLHAGVPIRTVDAHINDPAFARACCDALIENWNRDRG